jgi:hypothetical protein
MDLTGPDVEIHMVESQRAGKALGQPGDGEKLIGGRDF